MKKTCAVLWLAAFVAPAFAAKVDRVLVRQQWPWSSEVRVEYSVSGTEHPAAVSFKFFDGESELTPTDTTALKGDTAYAGNGLHIVTFDPKALFGLSDTQQFANFRVKVSLGEESALMSDKLYRIIDLDTGKITDLVRADFYNNKGYGTFETDFSVFGSGGWKTSLENVLIWTGVTNNPIYKTSKIVMRYITAKDQTFTMGDDSYEKASPAHQVTFKSDYYLSVFEITQAQLYKLTGSHGTEQISGEGHELWPAGGRWDEVWGRPNTWPKGLHDVTMYSGDFFGKLRSLVGGGIPFDYPTEARWEFACRAGTTTAYYTGTTSTDDRNKLGVKMGGTASTPEEVGSYLPNAFGLYDMYSNAAEWCLDYYAAYTGEAQIEPIGPDSTSDSLRIYRGTAYNSTYSGKNNATISRGAVGANTGSGDYGCRLWCPAE
jgi:formylglycine-generating enzyme required for sulfatase activity